MTTLFILVPGWSGVLLPTNVGHRRMYRNGLLVRPLLQGCSLNTPAGAIGYYDKCCTKKKMTILVNYGRKEIGDGALVSQVDE